MILPLPDPIKTRAVTWHALDTGSVCLTPQEYGDLAYNMSEILRWTEESGRQLRFYTMPKEKAPAD